jgi:integrase
MGGPFNAAGTDDPGKQYRLREHPALSRIALGVYAAQTANPESYECKRARRKERTGMILSYDKTDAAAKRRGHNEGTICKRPDGRWVALLNLGIQANGKIRRKAYYGETRKEAWDKLSEGREKLKKGIAPVIGRQSLAKFLETWLTDCIKPNVRPATWVSYNQQIRVHITPALGHIELTKLTPQQLQRYMNEKAQPVTQPGKADKPGLSAKTIRYDRSILVMALKQAHRWGMVARNVATMVDGPKAKRFYVTAIDQKQAAQLLDTLKGERLGAFFTVALALGLRRGETLGLRWQDVDLDKNALRVRYQITALRVGGELTLTELKTEESRRELPIPASLAVALRERRRQQLEERMAAADKWIDRGLVFTNPQGGPIDPRTVKRHLDRILKDAGMPHCRVHDLRHFSGSLLLALGVDLKTVSMILGHADIRTTANIYVDVLPSLKQDAIGALDRMLTGARIR